MKNSKVAIEVEIKNIKKIADLKKELKELRKEQKEAEKYAKTGKFTSKEQEKGYKDNTKAIKEKSKSLRDYNKRLSSTTTATKKATKSSNGMAKQFVKGAAAIGVVVAAFRTVNNVVSSVITTFSEFEFVMAKVNAVSGATDQEFKELTKTSEELGRTTFFTAAQVGELMLNFSKLGFTAQEIQNAVEPTLALATATGSDLARSATVAGAAIRGFGLDASETERVVDVMAVAFSSSAMDIEKWQTSMTKVAPIAKAAGFSIEDTAAIMSKLTDSGIEASIAGTSLRNILLKMQDPTSELSMRFGSTIHSLDQLVPAMKKFISEGGSMADVMEVVDLRQAAAFEQMLTTADGTLELRDALLDASGEGKRMADMVGDTLQGAFLKFTSALQGVSIELMGTYAKGLKKSVENLAKFLNKLASNIDILVRLIKIIKSVVISLGAYKIGVIAATAASSLWSKSMKAWAVVTGKAKISTDLLTVSLGKFRVAIGKTGIGLFILALIDLIYYTSSYNDEAQEAISFNDSLNKTQTNLRKSTENLRKQEEKLIEARTTINKLTDDNGKLLNKNRESTIRLRNAKLKESSAIRGVNTLLKKNGEELITVKTNTDDVSKSIDNLIKKMGEQALAKVFYEQEAAIISTKVSVEMALKDLREAMIGGDDISDAEIAKFIQGLKDVEGGFGMWMNEAVSFFAGDTPVIAARDSIMAIMDKYGITLGTLIEGSAPDYIKTTTESLKESVIAAADEVGLKDFSLTELLLGNEGGGDPPPPPSVINWANETVKAINMVKKAVLENKIAEEDYALEVAKNKKILLKAEFDSLSKTNKIGKKGVALKGKILDQELTIKKEQIKKQDRILENQYNKEKLELESKLAQDLITKADFDKAMIDLDIKYIDEKAGLYADNVNYLINLDNERFKNENKLDALRKQMMQEQISAMGGVGSALTSLAGDNEKLNAVKEAGNKISQVANILSSITTLKTNLETLGILKKNAAEVIANNTEKVGIGLAQVDNTLTATGTGLKVAETGATVTSAGAKTLDTGATIANTVATTLSLIPKAISTILSSAAAIPFPLNIVAIIATMALVKKVMKFEQGGMIEGGKKYANGGMVQGRSHAQGGEKFAVGGRVVELEGGEAVINKRSTAMYRGQLSAMNEAGGGVKFADGGLLNSPQFANQQFTSGMMKDGASQKVYVVESDITQSQRTVNVLESNATI